MNDETKLKNKCHALLKKHGIFHFKLSDKWYAGIPDLLIIYNGEAIWIELKTSTGVLSDIQKWTITELQNHGCMVYIVRSLDELKEILRGLHILKNRS